MFKFFIAFLSSLHLYKFSYCIGLLLYARNKQLCLLTNKAAVHSMYNTVVNSSHESFSLWKEKKRPVAADPFSVCNWYIAPIKQKFSWEWPLDSSKVEGLFPFSCWRLSYIPDLPICNTAGTLLALHSFQCNRTLWLNMSSGIWRRVECL